MNNLFSNGKVYVFCLLLLCVIRSVRAAEGEEIRELMMQRHWTSAEKLAREKLKTNPDDSSLYLTVGICSVNQKNYDDAVINLAKAHKLAPDQPIPPYLLGIIHEETGSFARAETFFRKAYGLSKDKEKKINIMKHIETVLEKMRMAGR